MMIHALCAYCSFVLGMCLQMLINVQGNRNVSYLSPSFLMRTMKKSSCSFISPKLKKMLESEF